jgi:hypothetical protein
MWRPLQRYFAAAATFPDQSTSKMLNLFYFYFKGPGVITQMSSGPMARNNKLFDTTFAPC